MAVWSSALLERTATLCHMAVARVVEIKRRRTYAGEEAWFGLLDELGHRRLRAGFITCGVSPQVAANLVFFIEDQLLLDRQFGTAGTKARYRKILAALDPEEVARAARAIPGQFNSERAA
jgi:hypothetical protein